MANTANQSEFSPSWVDLDHRFNDPKNHKLEDIFDDMVSRQIAAGSNLTTLSDEAQELLNQWKIDDDHDYLPDWRAAVARSQPGVHAVEDAREELLNDAVVLGAGGDDLVEFLGQEATFLLGEMWGARDRRNTLDGFWNQTSLTWMQWLMGQPGDKNTPAWGFTRHPEGKDKAGASIVLGSSIGGARKAKAMDTMYAMGLDVDSGAKLEEVVEKVEELGLLCFVYSSYNHNKRGIELKRDEVLRKMRLKKDPTTSEVRQFLREHDKNRYEEDFIARCTIKDQKHQTTEGVKIVLDTPPLQKFRLIFPLSEAVKIIDLAETHQAALDLWEDKVTGLARNMLGIHFDTSATDPSRLFYTARHPKGIDDWYCAVVQGKPLAFDDVEPLKKSSYTSKREVNAFTMAGGEEDVDRPPMAVAPSGASLNEWHRTAKDRLMMAELMETLCPDKIRVAGGEAQGTVHTECPFEHEHSSEGGTATMAVNCIDGQNEYWTWFCHHSACQGRHKLQFVEEALRQGWFEEDVLFNMDHGFLLEGADEDEDGEDEVIEEPGAVHFTEETSEDVLVKVMMRVAKNGDVTARARLTALIVDTTLLGKRDVNRLWKHVDKSLSKAKKVGGANGIAVNRTGFTEICEYGSRRIHDTNKDRPTVFHYGDSLCDIRTSSEGALRIQPLDVRMFSHYLNTVARFVRITGEDQSALGVSAPQDVVNHLYEEDKGLYPDLRGIISTPSFTANGALITEPGYDWNSKLYYLPEPDLFVPEVAKVPTADEVHEATRLLIEEVLADFRLDAVRREALMEAVENGRVDIPSVANALGMLLLPFMRDMIEGQTPGHLLNKRKPGSGSSYMVEVFGLLFQGREPSAQELPDNRDELSKVLTTMVLDGRPYFFFDNVNETIEGGALASALTSGTYSARILGKSASVESAIRSVWAFTGNNVVMSAEMVRRFCLITFDPEMANPSERKDYRHDVKQYVRGHRGELIHACLTIIQNWIAQGQPAWSGAPMPSFENWSRCMGGILEAAGIHGFLENQAAIKGMSTAGEDPLEALKERFAEMAVAEGGAIYVSTSEGVYKNKIVYNVLDILNDFYGSCEPLMIAGWGYDKRAPDGAYSDKAAVGRRFGRDIVKPRDHITGDVEIAVEEVAKPRGGSRVYEIMVKT